MISTKELAKEIGVHPETIRRLTRNNSIPFTKINARTFRFNLQDVLEALDGNGEQVDDF